MHLVPRCAAADASGSARCASLAPAGATSTGRDRNTRPAIEVWESDEPSLRGIEDMERMALIRDDIAARTDALAQKLATSAT